MLRKGSWPRLILTSFVLAIVLTAFADTTKGKHNAPLYDWIIFGILIVAIRLGYRAAARRIRRNRTSPADDDAPPPGQPRLPY